VFSKGDAPPTILVADDQDEIRELLTHYLRTQGYRVVCAKHGGEAERILREDHIDLALLDILMPERSGFELCRELKNRPETRFVPVVLITELGCTDDRLHGMESGADDFLNKPVRKEELLARVRSLLRVKSYTDELESAESVLCSLALSIEARDHYTHGHCDRLARYSVALAERLGLSHELCAALRRAGFLHDIGKVVVPDQILSKPGPLNAEERRIIESHPIVGEHICSPLKSFRLVLPIIRHHHEHMDGSGYPDHLRGEAIPLTARILQTVDVYDALATERPYRKALPNREVMRIMMEETRRGWWDAQLVEQFGTMLELGTPDVGVCGQVYAVAN
jgi:putative two-component system response regulator